MTIGILLGIHSNPKLNTLTDFRGYYTTLWASVTLGANSGADSRSCADFGADSGADFGADF